MKYAKFQVVDLPDGEDGVLVLSNVNYKEGFYIIGNDLWIKDSIGTTYQIYYGLDTYFPNGFTVHDDADKTEGMVEDDTDNETTYLDEMPVYISDSGETSVITQKFLLNVLAVSQDPSLIKDIK